MEENRTEFLTIWYINKLEFVEVFRMKLRLVKASNQYRNQISDMLDEWNATGEKIIPYAIERNIIVGAVNIRHYLNESLLLNGGHIGDGVRPSERRKGVATKMIALSCWIELA